jgi:hypothetical protein
VLIVKNFALTIVAVALAFCVSACGGGTSSGSPSATALVPNPEINRPGAKRPDLWDGWLPCSSEVQFQCESATASGLLNTGVLPENASSTGGPVYLVGFGFNTIPVVTGSGNPVDLSAQVTITAFPDQVVGVYPLPIDNPFTYEGATNAYLITGASADDPSALLDTFVMSVTATFENGATDSGTGTFYYPITSPWYPTACDPSPGYACVESGSGGTTTTPVTVTYNGVTVTPRPLPPVPTPTPSTCIKHPDLCE